MHATYLFSTPLTAEEASSYETTMRLHIKGDGFHELQRKAITISKDRGFIAIGGRRSLYEALSGVQHHGTRLTLAKGAGIGICVSRAGGKINSVKMFSKTAFAIARHKLTADRPVHIGGGGNAYQMSKTFAKTLAIVQVFGVGSVDDFADRPDRLDYINESGIDISTLIAILSDRGFFGSGVVRRRKRSSGTGINELEAINWD